MIQKILKEFLFSLSFFTRIPVGKRDFGTITLAQSAWSFPVTGAIIGALDCLIYLTAINIGLTNIIAAWVTIVFHIILTGGLHEDGLADTADGLASGRNREKKLAIMRDSHIGSYGVLALIIIISLRANIISGFENNLQTFFIFISAAACSRSLLAVFMRSTPYARDTGLAANAGKPALTPTLIAISLGSLSLTLIGNIPTALLAIIALAIIYIITKYIVNKNFGGITGDTLGATQQISEVTLLLIML